MGRRHGGGVVKKMRTPKRRPRGESVKDKIFGLEAFARQVVADIGLIRQRIAKLEENPPHERFLSMMAHELAVETVKQDRRKP